MIFATGEVIIWDLNKEDDMVVASSGIGDDSHREPVCKVQWIPDPESKGKKYHVSTFHIYEFNHFVPQVDYV